MSWYRKLRKIYWRRVLTELLMLSIPIFATLGMLVVWIVWGY